MAHLRSYVAREGHASVPQRYMTDDGFTLGVWVSQLRKTHKVGRLSAARIAELDALGMVWDPHEANYRLGVDHLRAYIAREGHPDVPATHVADDGFNLGNWVASRRRDRIVGRLSAARFAELSALGMVWNPLDANYRTRVNHLRSYIAREGHANVPESHVSDDGFALGKWLSNCRQDHKAGRLSTARFAELSALGMVWDPHEVGYLIGVDHLRAYAAAQGHANVPDSHVTDDGFTLGTWVRARRRDRTVGRLSTARITEMNALGMVWSIRDAVYRAGVDHLRAYAAAQSHANVPESHVADGGFALGTWLNSRRREHKAGTLSTTRVAELNALGMVWDLREANYRIGVAHLRSYVAREGHANVPQKYMADDGFPLGGWVRQRRKDHKIGRLSTAKIAELDALGMVWGSRAV